MAIKGMVREVVPPLGEYINPGLFDLIVILLLKICEHVCSVNRNLWDWLGYKREIEMSEFLKTKAGIAICPHFTWISENIEGLGHSENDVNLTHCTHPGNLEDYEGNCQEKNCPFI